MSLTCVILYVYVSSTLLAAFFLCPSCTTEYSARIKALTCFWASLISKKFNRTRVGVGTVLRPGLSLNVTRLNSLNTNIKTRQTMLYPSHGYLPPEPSISMHPSTAFCIALVASSNSVVKGTFPAFSCCTLIYSLFKTLLILILDTPHPIHF